MPPSGLPPIDAHPLLEHAQWMRRLARSLVADPDRAEELSQETWRRILERPPRLDRPFRGWIATVMRNLVRAEHRGTVRRATRERSSARPEAEPSAHELLDRATLQRELVQAVLELDEPYRTTILLRYFEERTPQEIAARGPLPLPTVKTRLARGLALLRERLERTRAPDGKSSALLALARFGAGPPHPSPHLVPLTVASVLMNSKVLVGCSLVVAAALALLLYAREDGPAPSVAGLPEAPAAEALSPAAPPWIVPSPHDGREETRMESSSPDRLGPAPDGKTPLRFEGRVIDLAGRPVGSVAIGLAPLEPTQHALTSASSHGARTVAHATADGTFLVEGPARGRLFVLDSRWTTVLAGIPVDARSGQSCRVVVAPSIALAGVALDEFGGPLADVEVSLEPPSDLRARIHEVLDFSASVSFGTRSDEYGRFRLATVPALEEGRLRGERAGYEPVEEAAPAVSRSDLVLVFARPGGEAELRGLVVDPARSPVAAALVSLGLETTRTDEHGRFTFQLDDPESVNRRVARTLGEPADVLRAVKPGYLPAESRARERGPDGKPLWPRPVVLQLGGPPASIAGRVIDEHGEALPGLRVWITDPSLFGLVMVDGGGDKYPEFVQVEEALVADAQRDTAAGWHWTETDKDGRFVLECLAERTYDLAVMDPSTLLRSVTPAVAAGRRDVVLVLDGAAVFEHLAGRVVDGRGEPVPHASVFPMCDALVIRHAGQVLGTRHETTTGTLTDEEGRFELARVPRNLVYLRIQGADTIPLEWGRAVEGGLERLAGKSPDELEIEVERRCHFQVELSVAAEADELGMLDSHGNELVISEFRGNSRNDVERHALVGGRSSTLAVGDRATMLVLYRAGSEVRRVPVRLLPGTTTSLKF